MTAHPCLNGRRCRPGDTPNPDPDGNLPAALDALHNAITTLIAPRPHQHQHRTVWLDSRYTQLRGALADQGAAPDASSAATPEPERTNMNPAETVHTQTELDAALAAQTPTIHIDSPSNVWLTLTNSTVVSVCETIGEPVCQTTLGNWIDSGVLHIRGFLHQGQVVPHKTRSSDPRVLSLSQVRAVRSQRLAAV